MGKNPEQLSVLGNNCFGLKAKQKSVLQSIKAFNYPSFITLQETKIAKNGIKYLRKYGQSWVGGLLTAVKLSLSPFLISPCNDEAYILVVQCLANNIKICVING